MHPIRVMGKSLILPALLLAGCASTPGKHELAERDPLEGFNRGVWAFNDVVDKAALKPATTAYRTVTPRPARRGLSRIFANLSEPFSAINNLLQGKPDRAMRNLGRFTINSTIGVGGLADHATGLGVAPAYEDFGQTLAVWGANGGPYLVLPILGPSTLRDGVGSGVAQIADPYRITLRQSNLSTGAKYGATGAEIINIRSEMIELGLDAYLESSLDPYSSARSAYLQRREAEIRDEAEPVLGATDTETSEAGAETDAVPATETPPETGQAPENQQSDAEAAPNSQSNNAY